MADDDSFPFSFGNVSDGEEENDFFVDKKAAKKRALLQASTEAYVPQIEADEVKMLSEYLYLHHRYEEAYEVAEVYCQVVKGNRGSTTTSDAAHDRSLKVTDCRELQDMMARAALKLGRAEEAARIVDEMTSPDPGFVFLKAAVYKAAKRYNACLTSSLALICISRSRFLMEAASWPETGFGHARYIRELTRIKEIQNCIEQHALKLDPQLRETDKVAYDQKVEAPIKAWQQLRSCEEQASTLSTLDRSVIEYIWETWIQTLKGDGSGAMSEDVCENDTVVKGVRDM
ncbi:hypothetical protein BGZ73_005170 [Actinomortierella ambigua]|nr:hypothetical protein BGZ73_005170 [Actinomortierella ambigua]